MKNFIVSIVLVGAMLGQTSPTKFRKTPAPDTSGIDTVIELVQGGAAESVVIKTLRSEGKVYKLLPADMLRLQKAGVSESIINVMMDPKAAVTQPTISRSAAPQVTPAGSASQTAAMKNPALGGVAPAPAPTLPVNGGSSTVYPPDLDPRLIPVRNPTLAIDSFGYRDVKEQAAYWFGSNSVDIGAGVSDMLSERLTNSQGITVLERNKLAVLKKEIQEGITDSADQGKKIKKGKLVGAEYMLIGDIVTFGQDNTTQNKKIPNIIFERINPKLGKVTGGMGTVTELKKDQKAVVTLSATIVDTTTGANVASARATGTSSRTSKEYSTGLATQGAAAQYSGKMTNSGFEKTIIGEATADAVNQIVAKLNEKLSLMKPKPREIETRFDSFTPKEVYLPRGKSDGILPGDRFEILQINGVVTDPDTKEKVGFQTLKVGELVVSDVSETFAKGSYGGQPLSPDYATTQDKGYQARLISK